MKKYIDLIKELSFEDKKTIESYIDHFGVNKNNFIGIEKWLQNWSHSKQNLYKLLGENFILECGNYSINKPRSIFKQEIYDFVFSHEYKEEFYNFYMKICKALEDIIPKNALWAINNLFHIENFYEDKIFVPIKIKYNNKKMLQIPVGMKPIRALQKVMDYFSEFTTKALYEKFEDFRLKHSLIYNDKIINGILCISIHPLDFITMSDNNYNWTSCMNWQNEGCYRAGTIEMMNSNNVVCCYLKNDENSKIAFKWDSDLYSSWNNKKWRTLFYVTKDIIMGGKAYPFKNEDITKYLLNSIVKLAKENLNWNYSFGPEIYKDMIHIHNTSQMEYNREWINNGLANKHNILFDTKGMYNDILNVPDYPYWCYRRKVKSNKIISLSGKCNCLICNNSIIEKNEYEEDYNSRFEDTSAVVCSDCKENFTCNYCLDSFIKINSEELKEILFTIKINNALNNEYIKVKVCLSCISNHICKCPDCGRLLFLSSREMETGIYSSGKIVDYKNNYFSFAKIKSNNDALPFKIYNYFGIMIGDKNNYIASLIMCPYCLKKHIENKDIIQKDIQLDQQYSFFSTKRNSNMQPLLIWNRDLESAEKYMFHKRKKISLEDFNNNSFEECWTRFPIFKEDLIFRKN